MITQKMKKLWFEIENRKEIKIINKNNKIWP